MSQITSDSFKIPTEVAEELPCEAQREVALQIGPYSRLYSQRQDGDLGVEQLRRLQLHLMELHKKRPFKRLLITSATRGEGKTHIAANLALTLAAESHLRVLLIDTDLRNSSVHLAYGIANSYGLKDWLVSGGNPAKAVTKVSGTNLYVMTGGSSNCELLGLSQISSLARLMDEFSSAYDLILLDSPPLLGTLDAKLLSGLADAALIVVAAGITPRNLIVEAQDSLQDQNVLGVVLNRLDPGSACFTSYYGHPSGARETQAVSAKRSDRSTKNIFSRWRSSAHRPSSQPEGFDRHAPHIVPELLQENDRGPENERVSPTQKTSTLSAKPEKAVAPSVDMSPNGIADRAG